MRLILYPLAAALATMFGGGYRMDVSQLEKVLRQGTDAAKVHVLREAFFSEPRAIAPTQVDKALLFTALGSTNLHLKDLALTWLGNRDWDEPRFFTEFAKISRDTKERVELRERALHFVCMRWPRCTDLLAELLESKDPAFRSVVANKLAYIDAKKSLAPEVQKLLVKAFHDSAIDVRDLAASSLRELAAANSKILDLPVGADTLTRAYFAGACVGAQPRDKTTIGELCTLLTNEDREVREAAAFGLQEALAFEPAQVAILDRALRDESFRVRRSIATLAGFMPRRYAQGLHNLASCLDDSDALVREHAVFAIRQLRDPANLLRLIRAMNAVEESPQLRYIALEAIVELGDASPTVIGAIREAIRRGLVDRREGNSAISRLKRIR